MLRFIILFSLIPVIFCNLDFGECPGSPAPNAARVVGCDELPCYLSNGDILSFEIDFSATFLSSELTIYVYVTAFGVTNEFPLEPPVNNGCLHLMGESCPIENGEYTIAIDFPLETEAQGGVPMEMMLRIENQNSDDVLCLTGGVVIV